MAKDKKPQKDRHKHKPLQLRLHPILRQELEAMAGDELTTMTALATRAIRKMLMDAGRLSPRKD